MLLGTLAAAAIALACPAAADPGAAATTPAAKLSAKSTAKPAAHSDARPQHKDAKPKTTESKAAESKPAAAKAKPPAKTATKTPTRTSAEAAKPAPAKHAETKHAETKAKPAKATVAGADRKKTVASDKGPAKTKGVTITPVRLTDHSTTATIPSVAAPALRAAPDPALLAPRDLSPPAVRQPAKPPLVEAPPTPPSEADVAAVRRVIEAMRGGDREGALALADAIPDPVARKLAEWVVLRFDDNVVGFDRYQRFIDANPSWPSVALFRRRAEATLWQERADPAIILNYFNAQAPQTAKGKLALARALLVRGNRSGAAALVRDAWRTEQMTPELEAQARDQFGVFITPGDDKARMESRLYVGDNGAALRAASRLGGAQLAIARARIAIAAKSGNAKALLEAVPAEARGDVGYVFARLQMLRREEKFQDAAALMLRAPREASLIHDTNEWWIERRLLARKLLDVGDARTAYQVAADGVQPEKDVYRVEQHFTAGWIALRFLHDPETAIRHFARIPQETTNPISLSRAGYWLGRAYEAQGRQQDARRAYESAARWTTAYYGQLARAKLGLGDLVLYAPPASAAARASVERLELVRAAEILYALDEKKLIVPLMADLGERLDDIGALTALGEITSRHGDARSMLLLGKAALARGYPFGQYAFPTVGLPAFAQIAPKLDQSVIFSIVRQESSFDPRDVSPAAAVGYMQVTPEAAKDTCRRFKCRFDRERLLRDSTYNLQVGAAELSALLQEYRGSFILTFAAYNAGRGSVRDWIARYGDPRDPSVDPIDWVERIPFSETRNYVQRVMENLQVYRVRFGGGSRLLIEADLRRGGAAD